MKATCLMLLLALPLVVVGCTPPAAPRDTESKEAKIQANLAKLAPEDRKLAEQQKFCAVETENQLGSMGEPLKVMIDGEPVFLCCDGCKKKALADQGKTLAKAKELRAQATGRE
jgi:hypothetical protein